MSATVRSIKPRYEPLRCWGSGRDAENPKAIIVYFNRPLTDDELRFFDECSKRTAALMPEDFTP